MDPEINTFLGLFRTAQKLFKTRMTLVLDVNIVSGKPQYVINCHSTQYFSPPSTSESYQWCSFKSPLVKNVTFGNSRRSGTRYRTYIRADQPETEEETLSGNMLELLSKEFHSLILKQRSSFYSERILGQELDVLVAFVNLN